MAKSLLRLEAIRLREQGQSVRDIATKLGVAKSSASLWTRHIILSVEQLENLTKNSLRGGALGRIRGALSQKISRLKRIELSNQKGAEFIGDLSTRELDLVGTCLYWAEGNKRNRQVKLCNSDPNMILLFIKWLAVIYNIPISELYCQIGINEAHKDRETQVRAYWSKVTSIPLKNFNKTSLKKYPLRKIYANFEEHYGTLSVNVNRPARIFYQILGKIHAISNLAT
jgi:transcriptional regulator with XRE-family HTH domain